MRRKKMKAPPAGAHGAGMASVRDDRAAWRDYQAGVLPAIEISDVPEGTMLAAHELGALVGLPSAEEFAALLREEYDGGLWGPRACAAEDVYNLSLDPCGVWAALDHGVQPGFEDLFGDRDARAWGPVLQAAY